MNDISANLMLGLQVALQPGNLLFCFLGALFGTMIGVLPGIGPVATIAMLLPITFYLDPIAALTMLAGIYYGSQYGGSTTSILVKVPGESSSVVTCIDGHEMALRGRAGAALAIAAIGSFIAGIIGTSLIVIFGPALAKIAGAFGAPEYFALMVLGLAASVVLAHGSLVGALAMILLGFVLGLVGRDINTGFPRLTFGVFDLADGVGFVPLAMGVFGIAEIMHNLDRGEARGVLKTQIGRVWLTRAEWRRAWPAVLRGTALGAVLGILPGGGSIIASFASYGLEKRVSRYPEEFGRGAIEGVAGPESANNAAAQASFIPLLTLGIPPNAVLALLVGGMMIHGITPGPNVMSEQPRLFWGLIISMFLGNVMLVIINLPLVGIWVQLLKVPYRILFPAIFLFCCIGVYALNNSVFEVLLTIGFALLGYFMLKVGLEAAPLLLGFVLGPLIEEHLRRTLMLSDGDFGIFLDRPLALAMLALAAGLVLLTLLPRLSRQRGAIFSEAAGTPDATVAPGAGHVNVSVTESKRKAMTDKTLDVLVICGSLRKGSFNATIARALPGLAPAGMNFIPAPSFAKFPVYNADDQTATGFPADVTALADAVRAADGIVIVSPEYNWSIPGGLKNAIDWLSRFKEQPFKDKPVAVQSAAAGLLGGSRMQYHLRQSLISIDVQWFGRPEVIVNFAAQKIENGELKDEPTKEMIRLQLAAFEKFVRKLSGKA